MDCASTPTHRGDQLEAQRRGGAEHRAGQENLIKDFKHGLGLSHVPTGVLAANQAYFLIAALAWRRRGAESASWRRGDAVQAVSDCGSTKRGWWPRAGAEVAARRILPAVRHGSRAGGRSEQAAGDAVERDQCALRQAQVRQDRRAHSGMSILDLPAGWLAAFLPHPWRPTPRSMPINSANPAVMPRLSRTRSPSSVLSLILGSIEVQRQATRNGSSLARR